MTKVGDRINDGEDHGEHDERTSSEEGYIILEADNLEEAIYVLRDALMEESVHPQAHAEVEVGGNKVHIDIEKKSYCTPSTNIINVSFETLR